MRGRTFAQMLRQHPLFAGLLTLQSLFVLLLLLPLPAEKLSQPPAEPHCGSSAGGLCLAAALLFGL
mgnify:CR=1 FL=1